MLDYVEHHHKVELMRDQILCAIHNEHAATMPLFGYFACMRRDFDSKTTPAALLSEREVATVTAPDIEHRESLSSLTKTIEHGRKA